MEVPGKELLADGLPGQEAAIAIEIHQGVIRPDQETLVAMPGS